MIDELKKKYNLLLHRIDKAEIFFNKCEEKEIDKYMPNFLGIVRELDMIGHEIVKITGRALTSEEVLEGFKEN